MNISPLIEMCDGPSKRKKKTNCKLLKTPTKHGQKLDTNYEGTKVDMGQYQRLIENFI